MLYKLLVYVLLVASADALKAGPISRRALLGKATAGALLSSPLAAFAKELKQASDASVYNRADDGALTSARVIQRAKDDQLVVGKGTLLPLMAAPTTATTRLPCASPTRTAVTLEESHPLCESLCSAWS